MMEVIPLLDWFLWNNTRCTAYGIHVLTQPTLIRPAERVTFTSVPGRSGSLTTLEGEDVYDDFILSAECIIENTNRLPEISAWLRGSGTVIFANRQGGFYYARIVNQISFGKILRGNPHRSFAVNFRCQPFWYQDNVQPITLTAATQFISNPGSVYSEPVITVYGSGDITLMVNSIIIELKGIEESITLDTPLMEANNGSTSLNSRMTGEFPVLQSGSNAVSWAGSVTKMVVQPNWRYL